jgi:Glucosyl transferase GtrII
MSLQDNEAAIAVPIGNPSAIEAPSAVAQPRSALGLRAWMLTAVLFLLPLATYWPATFHDYGLRDDYSNLREAHEEIGKVVKFCASHARPIYGWLLQATYGQTSSVQNLQWMRFVAALILGAISLVSFRGLRALGWSFNTSLFFAVLISLVPSAQVIAGWAVGWPYAATALLAIAGFFTIDGALSAGLRAGTGRAMGQWAVASGLMVVSALIYQPSALFYLVPLTGALIAQRRRTLAQTAKWAAAHLAFVVVTLGVAYCIMSVLYDAHVFVKSGRIAFETHWGQKIAWFLQEPLPNALSVFVLNDNNHRDHALYSACAALVGAILLAGAYVEWRRHGRERGIIWLSGLVGLPLFAFAVSLIASERYATYRTILALTGVLLCFLVASVSVLTEHWRANTRRMAAALVILIAFFTAQHHVYALIAVPQGNEWQIIEAGARHVRLDGARPSIFAIASTPSDISTATIYHDEFGSLSSNSEWVPREMFKRAMHDLHPEIANLDSRYDFATGPKLPVDQDFDVIIDLHRLRQFYVNN